MRLYHCPKTRSARIVWLLEELSDVPCEIVERRFVAPSGMIYNQDTPAGKFPTLEDDGAVFFESGAILTYILDRYGRGRLRPPSDSVDYGPYLQWVHFAEATIGIPVATINYLRRYREGDHSALRDTMLSRAAQSLAVLEQGLGGRPWLIGNALSGADIMCGYTVHLAQFLGVSLDVFPAVSAWSRRIAERPAWQDAMAGDPPY